MFDSLNWVMIGLASAFGLAGLSYYGWIFGIGSKMDGLKRIRMNSTLARLRGQFSERDPADDVEQALNDVLNGVPVLGGEPDEDVWIPEVRQPNPHQHASRQPGRQAIQS